MNERVVAKRYGKALFDLAIENDALAQIEISLHRIIAASGQIPSLQRGLSDESIFFSKRLNAANSISKVLNIDAAVRNLIKLMILKNRFSLFPLAAAHFFSKLEKYNKLTIIKACVFTEGVSEEVKSKIEEISSKELGIKTCCDIFTDPSILGGFSAWIGDVRYDASVRGKLDRIKEELYGNTR